MSAEYQPNLSFCQSNSSRISQITWIFG